MVGELGPQVGLCVLYYACVYISAYISMTNAVFYQQSHNLRLVFLSLFILVSLSVAWTTFNLM